MKCFIATMMIIGVILAPVTAMAVNYTFDGDTDNDWATLDNWNPTYVGNPLAPVDDLTVDGSFSPTAAATVNPGAGGSVTIDTSGTVTFSTDLRASSVGGTLTLNNGTVNVATHFFMGLSGGDSNVVSMAGGSLNVQGFALLGDGAAYSRFEQTGGAVSVGIAGGSGTEYIVLGSAANSTASWSISGGSLTGNNELAIGKHPANPPFAGVDATLEVIGTLPTSISCANMTVANGTGTLRFEMDAGGVTPVTASTSVTVTGGTLDLDFSTAPGAGDITLIDNQGGGGITGTFTGAPEGTTYDGGRFQLTYVGGTGNDLVLVDLAPPGQPGTLIYGK